MPNSRWEGKIHDIKCARAKLLLRLEVGFKSQEDMDSNLRQREASVTKVE